MIRDLISKAFLVTIIVIPHFALADELSLAREITGSIKGISSVYELSAEVRGDFAEISGFVESDVALEDISKLLQNSFSQKITNRIVSKPPRDDTPVLCAEVSAVILGIADKVEVDCEGSTVVLNGKVADRVTALSVAQSAMQYRGVTGIENHLETTSSDLLVKSDITNYMSNTHPELDIAMIDVHDGVLTISGAVPSKSALYDLVSYARLVPGISRIYDKTKIANGAVVTVSSINDSIIEETPTGTTTTMISKVANKDLTSPVEVYKN